MDSNYFLKEMTFDTDETIMDDFSIQRVTPPLVDPLTEAANAHLAALAEAEAAEMIIKPEPEVVAEPDAAEPDQAETKEQGQEAVKKQKSETDSANSVLQRLTSSSSSCSLSELQPPPPTSQETENKQTTPPTEASDSDELPKLKVPIPLVEENKEPGVSEV